MRNALIFSLALLATPALAEAPTSSVEVKLCRAQLELLVSQSRLNAEEQARFEKQCDCLDNLPAASDTADCTQAEDSQ